MPPENDTPAAGNEVDELLSSIESPNAERPMSAPAEEAPAAAAEPPTWDGKAWEFEWNGKKIVPESQDKAKIWISQGYNYSQRMGELNKTHSQRMAEAEQRAKGAADLEKRLSPYQKVDEYARQNPAWWQNTLKAYEQAQAGQPHQPLDPNLQQFLKPLEERLGKFEQHFTQLEQEKLQQHQAKEDSDLDHEIQAIRKEFPNIAMDAVDPDSGLTLEKRVLQHASGMFGHLPAYKAGIFKAAFRDYLHDQLIDQAKVSSREAQAKEAQVKAKSGVLGKTSAPVKELKPVNTKAPWNDPQYSADSILKEMGYA